MNKDFFQNKTVLVMGLGTFGGGLDSAAFAANAGAHVIVTDLADESKFKQTLQSLPDTNTIEFHLGGHNQEDFQKADIVIVNPAVPPTNRYLKIASEAGALITSQIELFFQLCPALIVGITGANGKSTTTALTAHLLESGVDQPEVPYTKVWIGGNIGHKPLLCNLDAIHSDHLVVLEISSFQLEQLERIKHVPDISVMTNLTPNHLDRHGSFEAYCQAKEIIFKYQQNSRLNKPVSIFNNEDDVSRAFYKQYTNDTNRMCILFDSHQVSVNFLNVYKLPGKANRSNLAAALAVANVFKITDTGLTRQIDSFQPLPDRLELVADRNNIRWYNDSIATTPASTIAALDAFEEPEILIAGGYDKQLAFDEMGQKIAQKAKAVILIGQTAESIAKSIESAADTLTVKIAFAESLEKAVQLADQIAKAGDVVLLSPACASYDMFENYRQRGKLFREYVLKL